MSGPGTWSRFADPAAARVIVGVSRCRTRRSIASATARTNSVISRTAGRPRSSPSTSGSLRTASAARRASASLSFATSARLRRLWFGLVDWIGVDQTAQDCTKNEHPARSILLEGRGETATTTRQIPKATTRGVPDLGAFQPLPPAGTLSERLDQVTIILKLGSLAHCGRTDPGGANGPGRQDMPRSSSALPS
jgi:hypothetical protein